MKRDMDLVRKILMVCADHEHGYAPRGLVIEGYSEEGIETGTQLELVRRGSFPLPIPGHRHGLDAAVMAPVPEVDTIL